MRLDFKEILILLFIIFVIVLWFVRLLAIFNADIPTWLKFVLMG